MKKLWITTCLSCTSIAALGILFALALFVYTSFAYENTFYPNTTIADINVSGKSPQEAYKILNERKTYFDNNLTLSSANVSEQIDPQQLGIEINTEETIKKTYKKGRSSSLIRNILEVTQIMLLGHHAEVDFAINEEVADTFIENKLELLEEEGRENTLELKSSLSLINGSEGHVLNRILLRSRLENAIIHFSPQIAIPYETAYPRTPFYQSNKARYQAQQIVSAPIAVTVNDAEYIIEPELLRSTLSFRNEKSTTRLQRFDHLKKQHLHLDSFILESLGYNQNKYSTEFIARIDTGKLGEHLKTEIDSKIRIEPKNARFQINPETNELALIENSTEGEELLIEQNGKAIEYAALHSSPKIRTVTLLKRRTGAQVTQENIETLGIKEVIGVGESNFAGSPSARRHNINVGTNKLTGVLVAPQEEYSLLSHLGEVTAETGYLPELVIKPGKTIKEYGGGLCQLGSTIFRGAMNSGLRITERQWHSYPVEYYKPYGTDATIYNPAPDFKFLNDTENYILIQGEVKGNKLYFTFYGTKDGRSVRFDGPHQWDHGWAGPGSLKAKWTQIVTYSDGSERTKTYWSNYKSPESYH